ncbi:DUF5723 family protein [Carboxylicivirga sp. N1Y90]|uniref:DUF5723 family protein n=1 Tax=Carboxylicivirga fragile TaxID=3417571 RepID=UPI003D32E1DC|nr:hypothetical protein [Marinilabiliaceae bacterium N1Y90]
MKRIVVLYILFLGLYTSFAQDFPGIHSSRYFPLQNINNQPADLIRSDARWNINVLSAQIGLANALNFNESDFMKQLSKVGFSDLKYFLGADQSLFVGRGLLAFPSVSYKINTKHAVAFSASLRADGIYRSSTDDVRKLFTGYDNPELLKDVSGEYFKSVVNQWMEYTLTWSGVLWNKDEHLITGGANVKYLVGGSSGYFDLDNIEVMYDKEKIDYFKVDVSYGVNKNLEETISDGKLDLFGDAGLGMDFGMTYSYKPDDAENIPYKFKVGLMVGDVGYVKHRSAVKQATYRVSIEDVPYSRFNGIETLDALIDSLEKSVDFEKINNESYKMNLPTSVLLTGDYSITPTWYVSGLIGYQPGLYSQNLHIIDNDIWKFNLTPRFENTTWGAYLPISYNNRIDFSAGIAMRWKYVFIGSNTIITNVLNSEAKYGEFYFGINIPIGRVE